MFTILVININTNKHNPRFIVETYKKSDLIKCQNKKTAPQ